jgi:hypothetical protein
MEDRRWRGPSVHRRSVGTAVAQRTRAATMSTTRVITEEARRVDAPLFCFAGAVRSALVAFVVEEPPSPPSGVL